MLVVHYCVAQMDLWVYQSYTFQGLQKLERSYSTQPIGQIKMGWLLTDKDQVKPEILNNIAIQNLILIF